MPAKTKGTNAERELVHKFWSTGWTAMRAAGSGCIKYPCPDLLVGNLNANKGKGRKLAIECKATKAIKQYLTKKEVDELQEFCRVFGAEPWIGVRFDKLDWYFLMLEDLQKTEGENYAVDIALAKRKGLLFEELII